MRIMGFGTEKIEDELKMSLPQARVQRMDLDSVRSKNAHERIINDFEDRQIDVLVGTQMVTKGLDFDNVSLVGILSADQLLSYPNFRSLERAYQLMAQVAGRSGRKNKQGKVMLQAYAIDHPILKYVIEDDYKSFYQQELAQRNNLHYPPFFRIISLTVRHKDAGVARKAANQLGSLLKPIFGRKLLGPAVPGIPRIRNLYLVNLMIKLDRKSDGLKASKQAILNAIDKIHGMKGFSGVNVHVDVDPY